MGELAFTLQDYFRFSGGMADLGGRSGSRIILNADDPGIPMAQRNNAGDLETSLAALNFNFSPSANWKHSGFIVGSGSKNQFGSISQRTYLNDSGNNVEILSSASKVENSSRLMKYAVTFTPKEETYVKYSAFGKYADIENRNLLNSGFGDISHQINNFQSRKLNRFQQKGEWYHAPSDKRVLSMEVNWEKSTKIRSMI